GGLPLAVSQQPNANSWSKIGFVEGNGTANSPKTYSFTDKNLTAGKFSYRLKQIDRDGKFGYSQAVELTVGGIPKVFTLDQNYPNPFNPTTTIGFTIPADGMTTLKIYNTLGQEVTTLVNEPLKAGEYHQAQFDASSLASGIYFARLQSADNVQVKKLMLLK
ncbi:MAG: T9SS type A sorting domain-containing protein, partial [Bacteroidota bacterium]